MVEEAWTTEITLQASQTQQLSSFGHQNIVAVEDYRVVAEIDKRQKTESWLIVEEWRVNKKQRNNIYRRVAARQ